MNQNMHVQLFSTSKWVFVRVLQKLWTTTSETDSFIGFAGDVFARMDVFWERTGLGTVTYNIVMGWIVLSFGLPLKKVKSRKALFRIVGCMPIADKKTTSFVRQPRVMWFYQLLYYGSAGKINWYIHVLFFYNRRQSPIQMFKKISLSRAILFRNTLSIR